MARKKVTAAEFIDGLLEIASETCDVDDAGDAITNGEALRQQIWKMALGWTETVRDDDGGIRTVTHKPVAWAIEFLYGLIVGKPATMVATAPTSTMKAADKVRALARERLNAIGRGTTGPPVHKAKPRSVSE